VPGLQLHHLNSTESQTLSLGKHRRFAKRNNAHIKREMTRIPIYSGITGNATLMMPIQFQAIGDRSLVAERRRIKDPPDWRFYIQEAAN